MYFDRQFITRVLSGDVIISDAIPQNPSFSVDSRTLQVGDIFIAIRGTVHDGHDFIDEALRKGAVGLIVQHDRRDVLTRISAARLQSMCVLVVYNTLQALLDCARAWRAQFNYPVVAVTGSLGKTSTKERISQILHENNTHHFVSCANQNTLIGVALNILNMRVEHEAAIFEVATGNRGDIVNIVDVLRPTNAVVTCIGHQHMGELGSLEDIAQEKRAVFKYLSEENIGVIYGDQALLSAVAYAHPVIKFGSKTTNQIQVRKVHMTPDSIHFVLKIYKKKYPVVLKNVHEGSINNALAATAIAYLLKVPDEVIVRAIQKPLEVPGRFEHCIMKNNRGILINDTYNANPESVKAALTAFHAIETKAKKILVLGDMQGLGQNSPFWHRQIGRFLRKIQSLKAIILVGSDISWTKRTSPMGLPVNVVASWQEAIEALNTHLDTQSLVLVKGSRSLHLENVVNEFVTHEKASERQRLWHQ
jgi:UDP-N-acetylmuramoyl-tripeptide--D-alanyl-D-alanine ligase